MMAIAEPIPAIERAARWHARFATPVLLQVGLGLTCLLSLAYCLAIVSNVLDARATARLIGQDTARSIVSALQARSALADADANVANYLVAPGDSSIQSAQDLERDLDDAIERMLTSAETNTFGEAGRQPLKAMQYALRTFLEEWGQARELHRLGEDLKALVVYRDATLQMREVAFPSAEALAGTGYQRMVAAVDARAGRLAFGLFALGVLGLLLAVTLIGLQLFVARRYRRTLNPALLIATVLSVGFALLTGIGLLRQADDLRIAKEDAFDAIHVLWTVRAVAFDSNADGSRWLFDREWADRYQDTFNAKTGYLTDTMAGQTAIGRGEALAKVAAAYAQYIALDGEMRNLERSGDHKAAMALKIGLYPGQVNWAFGQLDQTFEEAISVSQKAFDRAIARSIDDIQNHEFAAVAVALVVAFLTWLGLRPRLREYSA